MAKQMTSASTAAAQPCRTLPFQRRVRYSGGAGLRLLSRLQTTLEPERLLRFYFEDLADLLGLDGLSWEHADLARSHSFGRHGRTRMIYRLRMDEGVVLGELTVSRRTSLSDLESQLLEQSIGLLVHPLHNAVLYQTALTAARRDHLTGLGNRAALDEGLPRELELARRHGGDFSVVMLDVDRFKQINDCHGHQAGDAVLRSLAEVLRRCARQSDLLFRYAGDEFVIAMSHTPPEGAMAVADRVRAAVAAEDFVHGGVSIPMRVSLGVASATEGEEAGPLIHRADQALLQAKRQGRNQIEIATDGRSPTHALVGAG